MRCCSRFGWIPSSDSGIQPYNPEVGIQPYNPEAGTGRYNLGSIRFRMSSGVPLQG